VVVFLGGGYQKKGWWGIEYRAFKEIIMERDHKRLVFIRTNDESVDGVLKTDGYVDAGRFSPAELACYVHERADLAAYADA
jgi:hypothetical protein